MDTKRDDTGKLIITPAQRKKIYYAHRVLKSKGVCVDRCARFIDVPAGGASRIVRKWSAYLANFGYISIVKLF